MQASQSEVGHRRLRAGGRVTGSPSNQPAALVQPSHIPSQLCGRRVFYQLLVCDNAIESDIGAPYYSNQQLFPGFMMTEYDGKHSPLAPSLVACPHANAGQVDAHECVTGITLLQAGAG